MNYKIGIKAIKNEKEYMKESKMWDIWLVLYPNMNKETFIGFEEFKNMHNGKAKKKENESRDAIDNIVSERRKQ